MNRIAALLVTVLAAFLFTATSSAQMQAVLSRAPTFSPKPAPDPGIFNADFVMPPSFHNTDDRPGVPLLGDSKMDLFVFCFDPFTLNLLVCNVQLAIHVEEGSGGHVHTAGRPDGTLDHSTGQTTTDPNNPLKFVIRRRMRPASRMLHSQAQTSMGFQSFPFRQRSEWKLTA